MKYSNHIKKSNVAQTEKLSDNQVLNNAGGYVYSLNKWNRLNRFLILGSEGGSYYQSEKVMTKENAKNVIECITENGVKVVNTVVSISKAGRAAKNEPAIFVLALVCAEGDLVARQLAHKAIVDVCRTGTHLFSFCQYIKDLSGFGRGVKRGIGAFYLNKDESKLVNQVLKYRQRDGWTHRDVLRLTHVKTSNKAINEVLKFAATPKEKVKSLATRNEKIGAFINLQNEVDASNLKAMEDLAVEFIVKYKFTWEMVPTELLNSKKVWTALLVDMPMTALVRNLGKLSTLELLKEFSDTEKLVIDKLTNRDELKRSKIHPISLLLALKTYSSGAGFRGSNTWKVNQRVVEALEDAFYAAFDNVESTGNNIMLALDVSGSMGSLINNTNLSAREAAAAMAMLTLRTEKNVIVKGFTNNFIDLKISKKDSLKDICSYISRLSFGGTDCSLPMVWALENKVSIDTFIVYTDNETYYGGRHPSEVLKDYRKKVNPNAKLIVVGITATEFTIADSSDAGMLDVVGFDSSAPQIMEAFIRGEI